MISNVVYTTLLVLTCDWWISLAWHKGPIERYIHLLCTSSHIFLPLPFMGLLLKQNKVSKKNFMPKITQINKRNSTQLVLLPPPYLQTSFHLSPFLENLTIFLCFVCTILSPQSSISTVDYVLLTVFSNYYILG